MVVYVSRVYLRGLVLDFNRGSDSCEVTVRGLDYKGEEFHGVFNTQIIRDGRLEVRVISTVNKSDQRWIVPAEGKFDGREYPIPVKTADLEPFKIESPNCSKK